jgi:parallel beta-helix repeat protein
MSKNASLAGVLIFLVLIASGVIFVGHTKAQYQGDITINADGSITPSSAPILQSDNSYSLTSNINGSITIERSNITLQGNKYTITVPSISSSGITLNNVSNCTVANFTIAGGQYGINIYGTHNVIANNSISSVNNGIYSIDQPTGAITLSGSSNVISGNNFANDVIGINFIGGLPTVICSYNLIIGNTFVDCSLALLFYDSSFNVIYHNNFIANAKSVVDSGLGVYPQVVSLNSWDNGYPSGGNYWSDYHTKYSNAIEIDNSGIGNKPYIINSNNTDNYPLLKLFSNRPTIGNVTTSPTASPTPTVPELSWLVIFPLMVSMLSVAVIVRHRKKVNKSVHSLVKKL